MPVTSNPSFEIIALNSSPVVPPVWNFITVSAAVVPTVRSLPAIYKYPLFGPIIEYAGLL